MCHQTLTSFSFIIMPTYDLELKAVLENVESISADEKTIWRVKMECSNCQEVSPSFIEISSQEEVDVPGTRGTCNCLYTCKGLVLVHGIHWIGARGRSKSMWRPNRSRPVHRLRSGPNSFPLRCVEENQQNSSQPLLSFLSLMTRMASPSCRKEALCLKTWICRTILQSTTVKISCDVDE